MLALVELKSVIFYIENVCNFFIIVIGETFWYLHLNSSTTFKQPLKSILESCPGSLKMQ